MITSIRKSIAIISVLVLFSVGACSPKEPIQVMVITGGHAYDTLNFISLFDSLDGIETEWISHPEANDLYGSDSIEDYDVLVFYDMYQGISEAQKEDFLNVLEQGKGLVFLHHSIASYQDWPEFFHILGARYFLNPAVHAGDSIPASTYYHDETVKVDIIDPTHPVTKNMETFVIHEETYAGCERDPNTTPILRTDHPLSDEIVGWAHEYRNSRIVYLQSGHDNNAYSHPAFQQLLKQAISWAK